MSRLQFLLVEVAGERFAVDCEQVHALARRTERPAGAAVRDLAAELKLKAGQALAEHVLAARVAEQAVEFWIEQAHDVVEVDEPTLKPLPTLLAEAGMARGIRRGLVIGNDVVLVVDLETLVGDAQPAVPGPQP